MKISEIFYSVQGEGPNSGTPAIFVRLVGCNMNPPCVWCDTKYALTGGKEMSVAEVVKEIEQYGCRNVVFTGGEPVLQKIELEKLMHALIFVDHRFNFEVETNGLINPANLLGYVTNWIISPKLSNCGNNINYTLDSTRWWKHRNRYLKFVVDKEEDLIEITKLLDRIRYTPSLNEVYLMPQAITTKEHKEKLPFMIEYVKKAYYSFKVTPRLQILAFGNKRGV